MGCDQVRAALHFRQQLAANAQIMTRLTVDMVVDKQVWHLCSNTVSLTVNLPPQILVIAVLMRSILHRSFNVLQWEALVLLVAGITVNQLNYCTKDAAGGCRPSPQLFHTSTGFLFPMPKALCPPLRFGARQGRGAGRAPSP